MNELTLSEQQSTELIERLKRGEKPLVWLRNGTIQKITGYLTGKYTLHNNHFSWTQSGQFDLDSELDEIDIVALVDESELEKLFQRDVEWAKKRQPKAGDYLIAMEEFELSNVRINDICQIREVAGDRFFIKSKSGYWLVKSITEDNRFRFATTEEIAAYESAKEPTPKQPTAADACGVEIVNVEVQS